MFFDSEMSGFPLSLDSGGPSIQGLFGAKIGHQGKSWGIFAKARPGFIYYDRAWSGGYKEKYDSLTRFACDAGGVVEVYPSRKSTLRFDVGTTLVRYLRDNQFNLSPVDDHRSSEYYVTQGNLQITTGYTFRF